CRSFRGAIVSTSANLNGRPPALSAKQVQHEFADGDIDVILEGRLGGLEKPTRIIDALTGTVCR
ncbi:MAG TPA: tRNA threonylcarbamoyladenosine biosynthesis protein RimN, partial [Gammaproteobacteria bacterium]|nr:tRNA threonylcarbamoyladenosine biosynthesis protein RimN [Gammaproteobacteria bacterium]